MTRKVSKKPTAKKKKKPAKPKTVTAYIVVREVPSEGESYTEPTCVFASKKAALARARAMNAELRALTNPFERYAPDDDTDGGERVLLALLKKLKAPAPKKPKGAYSYIDWETWWDRSYFDLTDAQREAVWDALDGFRWYKVKTTTVG